VRTFAGKKSTKIPNALIQVFVILLFRSLFVSATGPAGDRKYGLDCGFFWGNKAVFEEGNGG